MALLDWLLSQDPTQTGTSGLLGKGFNPKALAGMGQINPTWPGAQQPPFGLLNPNLGGFSKLFQQLPGSFPPSRQQAGTAGGVPAFTGEYQPNLDLEDMKQLARRLGLPLPTSDDEAEIMKFKSQMSPYLEQLQGTSFAMPPTLAI